MDHADGAAQLAFGALATTGGAVPAWDPVTATCSSSYCHGQFVGGDLLNAPSWTTVNGTQAACGTCHGAPPPAPHTASTACGSCHDGYTQTSVNLATHVNGIVEAEASPHAAGWADPAQHGKQVNLTGLAGCKSCHGDLGATTSCGTCHAAAGFATWDTSCTFCHGSTSTGRQNPPLDIQGRTLATNVSVGVHEAHATTTIATAVACVQCHPARTASVATDAAHIDGNGIAEVVFGTLAKTGGANATYTRTSATSATCASTYCHGRFSGGVNSGSGATVNWTSTTQVDLHVLPRQSALERQALEALRVELQVLPLPQRRGELDERVRGQDAPRERRGQREVRRHVQQPHGDRHVERDEPVVLEPELPRERVVVTGTARVDAMTSRVERALPERRDGGIAMSTTRSVGEGQRKRTAGWAIPALVAVVAMSACGQGGSPAAPAAPTAPLVAHKASVTSGAGCPETGVHTRHLNLFACSTCHPTGATFGFDVPYTFTGGTTTAGGTITPRTATTPTTCTVACHFPKGAPAKTVAWDTPGPLACVECHATPSLALRPPRGVRERHARRLPGVPHAGRSPRRDGDARRARRRLDGYQASPEFHALGANAGLRACQDCHGADLTGGAAPTSCAQCHDVGLPAGIASWKVNCVMCHGGTDSQTGAPPVATWGNSGDAVRDRRAHPARAPGAPSPRRTTAASAT